MKIILSRQELYLISKALEELLDLTYSSKDCKQIEELLERLDNIAEGS